MILVISGSDLLTGGFARRSLLGFSVAKAKAPKVSIIRFTNNSWTVVMGVVRPPPRPAMGWLQPPLGQKWGGPATPFLAKGVAPNFLLSPFFFLF
jgi:hypothetical protein